VGNIPAFKYDLSFRRTIKPQNASTRRGFPGATLAHQTERFTLLYMKADAVNRLYVSDFALQ
jgi:hypothetical protein